LPTEAKGDITADQRDPGEEVEFEEEMDEESTSHLMFYERWHRETDGWSLAAAKHAAFVRARGRHYSNEAEAMKVSLISYPFALLTMLGGIASSETDGRG
jgi:protein phosphatase inhibitor 2